MTVSTSWGSFKGVWRLIEGRFRVDPSGVLLRNLHSATKVQKPYLLVYMYKMVISIKLLNSNPVGPSEVWIGLMGA